MATPPLSRDKAREAIDFVNAAIKRGFSPSGKPSAVEEGFRDFKKKHRNVSRAGFQSRVRTARERYDMTFDEPPPPPEPDALPSESRPEVAAPLLGGTPLHAKITLLQDEVSRLTRELKQAHRDNNVAEIIHDMIGHVASTPRELPRWLADPIARKSGENDPEVPVTAWADWHLGEVVESQEVHDYNAYNMHIAEERVNRLFSKTIYLAKEHHTGNYPGVVINVVGDMVSGGLHPELQKTDDLEAIPASLKAIDWLVTGITMMRDHFGRVFVPMVCGNHGRSTPKPEFKRYNQKNFDYLIAKMVERHFADDPRVTVVIRPSNDVHYRVYGIRYLLVHGDMLGVKGGDGLIGAIGPITRGEVKKSGQSAALGLEYDNLIMGHWHQELWLPRAIVSNTLKGFDEYARLGLGAKPSRPTQPLWFVHPTHGVTARWSVYVDKPAKPATEWLSVFKDAA